MVDIFVPLHNYYSLRVAMVLFVTLFTFTALSFVQLL